MESSRPHMVEGQASGQREGWGGGATSPITGLKSPGSPDFPGCCEGIFAKVGGKGVFSATLC